MALLWVANATANNATGSAVTGSLGTVVAGQLVVLTIADDSSLATPITSVADNLGNTYTKVPITQGTSSVMLNSVSTQQWYSVITTGGTLSAITVTWNTAATGRVAVAASYFNGFVGTPTLDQKIGATGTSTSATATTGTTTDANEIVVGGSGHAGTTSAFTAGSGMSNLATVNVANAAVAQSSKIVSATAAQTAANSIALSRAWGHIVSTWKDVVTANTLTMPVITSTAVMYAPTLSQKAQTVTDNFNDNSIDTATWTKSFSFDGTQVLEQNTRLEITHANTAQYNALATLNAYDLTSSYFTVKLTDVGNQALTSHEVIFSLYKDNNNKLYFDINLGNMIAYKMIAGVQTQVGSTITYNGTTHLYLRFIESGGTINMDTSPDGATWTNRFSLSNPWAVTALQILLQTGAYAAEASGSRAYFDDFNIGGIPPQSITLSHISSTATMYAPTLTVGPVTVTFPLIASTAVLYAPTVIPPAQGVTMPQIASTATMYQFSLLPITILTLSHISSTATMYAPTVVPGPVSLTLPVIASTLALYSPTVIPPAQPLTIGFIASTAVLYAPDVGIPKAPITVPLIASTLQMFAPSFSVQGPVITMSSFLGPTAQVFAPTVAPGTFTMVLPRINSTLVMYGPLLTIYIRPGFIASTAQLFQFSLAILNVPLTGWTSVDQPGSTWATNPTDGAATWTPSAVATGDWDLTDDTATAQTPWTKQEPEAAKWEVRA